MRQRIIFPAVVDYVRMINENIIDNLRAGRTSFVMLPSLYERAFAIVYETTEIAVLENFVAPDESVTQTEGVNIITGDAQ